MEKRVKMLKKLIERMEDYKDRPSDSFKAGCNAGIDSAITVINEKIDALENAED